MRPSPAPTPSAVVIAPPAPPLEPEPAPDSMPLSIASAELGDPFPAGAPPFDPAAARAAATRQLSTPRVTVVQLRTSLTKRWATRVGTTTFRTTMALVGGKLVIGTHGRTLNGLNEPDDGVVLLDAVTGKTLSTIRSPGRGDLDVGGIAVDGDRVVFGTDNGQVVAATLAGTTLWTSRMAGKVRAAPALGDLDGDGTADAVVGDESGALVALDGKTGRQLWLVQTGTNAYGAKGFIGAAAIGDLDRDGRDDVVAGARDGMLAAYRGRDGNVLWQVRHDSGIHASPSLIDFDGDGTLEVLAAWSYSELAVLDAARGDEIWGQGIAQDGGGIEGLFGTPIPLPGTPGVMVTPTAWWDAEDGIVGVGPTQRAWKSFEGRVTASAVVTDLDGDGAQEAIVGTERGALLALRADGGRAVLATLAGGIEAPALLGDTDGNGTVELLVASRDGMLTCFETGSRAKPVVSRFRGSDPRNTGQLGPVSLGWRAAAGTVRPVTGPAAAAGSVRIDYLECCSALQTDATHAPNPYNRLLLQTAAACNQLAAIGQPRAEAMRAIATALAGKVVVPSACR